jgi:hypothetical protein
MTEGRKDDKGKLRWSLLPTGTVRSIIEVLEIGAKKYDVDNWKQVPDARTRYYDAMQRHIEAWWNGQKLDPEDGLHHLAHAGCCLLFLLWLDKSAAVEAPKSAWVPWHGQTSMPTELLGLSNETRVLLTLKSGQIASGPASHIKWDNPEIVSYMVVR